MCGIIGYIGNQVAAPILVSGLRRLEYRGYDSAGIATVSNKKLRVYKSQGKLAQLESRLPKRVAGKVGIGHTRWATHGEPSDANAHPHVDNEYRIAVVHNGIIENAAELRKRLQDNGCSFRSDTDTEVLAHLIASFVKEKNIQEAVRHAIAIASGTYGIAVIDTNDPTRIVVARNGSPVIIGLGDREMFVASDVSALVRHTRQVVHLDDGELAVVDANGYSTITKDAIPTTKSPDQVLLQADAYDKGSYGHFMLKEIYEQPEAVARTLSGRLDEQFGTARLGGLNLSVRDLLNIRRIKILGCGSAYYAGLAGAHLLETLTRVPSDAEPAAEFRYRDPVIEDDVLYIFVSQSGETYDTLAALKEVKRKGGTTLGVINVVGSTIGREVDGGVYMHAGPEISVASTKAYTCMGIVFALLALHIGRIRDLSPQEGQRLVTELKQFPKVIEQTLKLDNRIKMLARVFYKYKSAFYIGRANAYPVALEGSQKLKEISYIHAEAYPSSELKHGPLALISSAVPTIVALPNDILLDKSISSLEEIRARQGRTIVITNSDDNRVESLADELVRVPDCDSTLTPLVMGIPLQFLAYHTAIALKRDIDQPRNLAKSVTVE